MNHLHCISGLPRSGSTLLASLLSQNPEVHASMSGPVVSLLENLLVGMSGQSEYSVFLDDTRRERVLRAIVHAYYEDRQKPYIIDTNRAWCAHLPLLWRLFPEAKIVACVRQMPWILDSIERLVQKNSLQPSSMFNFQAGGTVYSRTENLAGASGFVGFSYNALKEAYFHPENAGRILFLRYESLTTRPRDALETVAQFLDLPAFDYDLENIVLDAHGFDEKVGMPGLHAISGPIRPWQDRSPLLPPDLFQRYVHDAFWENEDMNVRAVEIF